MRNHSVTHLMHKALREVLGPRAAKGLAGERRAHPFDFAHNAPVTGRDPRDRTPVNEGSWPTPPPARVMDIESAQKTGAMMLFGEKYGETVRVLDIGSSRELCGGTHVQRTGDIGLFKVVAEGGVAAGVRRIEAVTGINALAYLQGPGRHREAGGRRPQGAQAELERPHCPGAGQRPSSWKGSRRPQGQAGLRPGR